jgi:histidinol-phosphate aminotransferase
VTRGLRQEILDLGEYTLQQYPYRIKLNQNENPYELPRAIKDEIMRQLSAASWSRYPPFVPKDQIAAVARFMGWTPEGVLLGNGSNDLLQLLMVCLLERGASLVVSQPTFTLYKLLAQSLGARVLEVPMRRPFAFDVDRIIEVARENAAEVIVLCSPNNPTGTMLSEAEVRAIIERTSGLVVLDEAYVQFAPQSLVRLLATYNRLVILQTFSKAMAAAGLRFGYALCAPSLARQLNKVKLPYGVNIFTLIAVNILIDRWDLIKDWIVKIVAERQRLQSAMGTLGGIRVYDSGANFLLFETLERGAGELFRALAGKGILIRDVSSYPLLERGLRVSIGRPEENDAFLSALSELL